MTHQLDTEKLAREAGFDLRNDGVRDDGYPSHYFDCWPEQLKMFAALVLEEAAKMAGSKHRTMKETEEAHHRFSREPFDPRRFGFGESEKVSEEIATAIRALAGGVR